MVPQFYTAPILAVAFLKIHQQLVLLFDIDACAAVFYTKPNPVVRWVSDSG